MSTAIKEKPNQKTYHCKNCLGKGKVFKQFFKGMKAHPSNKVVKEICKVCKGKGTVTSWN